jgi:hypothetical protein
MVKEFEHQNDQDLAILVDPWLPRVKVTPEQREAIESAIRFAASVCVESCRQAGRRILLGWTGPTPVVVQGVASTKLLHEFLGNLAVMRPATEGQVSGLLDVLPPGVLRESLMVLVSTRPVNIMEEAERSSRLSGGGARGIAGRVIVLNSAQGDLNELISFGQATTRALSRR